MDLNGHKIILASKSPRRTELLSRSKIEHEVRSIETDESYPADLPKDKIAEYIAYNKAIVHRTDLKDNEVVIAADTVVEHEGIIYGKPKSRTEAIATLCLLSNEVHNVYSGVCLLTKNRHLVFTNKSEVKFNQVSEEEAAFYFDAENPSDKAGSYGIQDWIGITKVDWIKGSYSNILGLPMAAVYEKLSQFLKDK